MRKSLEQQRKLAVGSIRVLPSQFWSCSDKRVELPYCAYYYLNKVFNKDYLYHIFGKINQKYVDLLSIYYLI